MPYTPLTKEVLDSWYAPETRNSLVPDHEKKGEAIRPKGFQMTMVRREDSEKAKEWLNSVPEEECDTCGGSGEVTTMEQVYPGEPHMADVGVRPCPDCQNHDVDRDEE